MNYKTINCDSVLVKTNKNMSMFLGDYTIDPYQNCEFGCRYCDSSFDKTIYVKTNAAETLKKELTGLEPGRIIIGSVHDPYQKAEEKYGLTHKILEVIKDNDFTCNILTKSDLVIEDIDLLSGIKDCIVTISMLSFNEEISNVFEYSLSSPKNRLLTVKKLNESNIRSGVALMPVLPYLFEEDFEDLIKNVKESKAEYLLFKHLELKGDQKNIFLKILAEYYPDLVERYEALYAGSYFPKDFYIDELNSKIKSVCKKYGIPMGINI